MRDRGIGSQSLHQGRVESSAYYPRREMGCLIAVVTGENEVLPLRANGRPAYEYKYIGPAAGSGRIVVTRVRPTTGGAMDPDRSGSGSGVQNLALEMWRP